MIDLETLGKNAKKASELLLTKSEREINELLKSVAKLLTDNKEYIKKENEKDVKCATEKNKSASFIDRLILTDKVIDGVAEGVYAVSKLKSPVNKTVYRYKNGKQGIKIEKRLVPFGVVGMIYEARPNVTADAFSLSVKTKNAVILKGGSDALYSNTAIVNLIKKALKDNGFDENTVSLITDTSHETATKFMQLNAYVDLLIPRGGASLIKNAVENATVPIIETGTGNCHAYIDDTADIDKAVKVIFNAKTQRYSVCNALESLVINKDILNEVLPKVYNKLREKKVIFRCDDVSYRILQGKDGVDRATEEDFYKEYGDAIISVKVVNNIDEAIDHVNKYGTHHSETIITQNKENAKLFQMKIDSSCVYVNASTRFSDGFVFGLGAEIGISTQKLHARGPMGLNALLTTKYFVSGKGATRI
ncbi:MAG: glutamate-5-semialdehyde dehydrogenase [Clostridia bacterium]|nr:glutamate-5-semialdehyde dehydrogenase [Clostridia bacterium]